MEGMILSLEAMASPWSIIGGMSLLAVVAGVVLFGYMAEEEKAGRRFYWAEWPIPESEPSSHEEELRLAA
ncbi:MAG: hypothetical protein FIA90_02615 [candidate division NC10 bacterium]|nr:hypothetical protein [candidate division NC10 bacterium]